MFRRREIDAGRIMLELDEIDVIEHVVAVRVVVAVAFLEGTRSFSIPVDQAH